MRGMQQKFGKYVALLPWMPAEMIQWHGPWQMRNLAPQMAAAVKTGAKPGENMPNRDWVAWGNQGAIITGIRQCIRDNSKFKVGEAVVVDKAHADKIVALALIQPPGFPTEREKRWRVVSDIGPYLWHRFGWVIPFAKPIKPFLKTYSNLTGGFMNKFCEQWWFK